ncbi:MAG: nucleoside monophosphate kinase [Candidatus Paceibacterota bacterium]
MSPQAFVFVGRAGAGKGTQAKLLKLFIENKDPGHPVIYVETGAEFRKFNEGPSYTASLSKSTIDRGIYMPEFMPIYIWGKLLVEKYSGKENLILDGTPRKPMEANVLESLFPFYNLGKPWVIYLDIDHDESIQRLTLRAVQGRKDDTPEGMENRRKEYEKNVAPIVAWYRTNPNVNFLDIDGERPIEEIHTDIVKRVGLA